MGSSSPSKAPIVIGFCLLVIGLIWTGRSLFGGASPTTAAREALERVVRGDVDFLYENAHVREKQVVSRELLHEFFDAFLRGPLKGATIVSVEDRYKSANKAVVRAAIKLRDGRMVQAGSLGYLEEGIMIVPAFESLFYTYASVLSWDEPHLPSRVKPAWNKVAPWLHERGISTWYSSQDDLYYPVPKVAKAPP